MAETVESIAAKLTQLRALRARVDEGRLEGDDWDVVQALLSEAIVQAKAGQEWVSLELSDEEDGSA